MTALLFEQAFSLKMDVDKLFQLLVSIHRKAPKRENLAKDLYDAVMDEVATHGAYFPKTGGKNKNIILPSTLWGEYTTESKKDVLWIVKDKFEEFAGKYGFENCKPYLPQLEAQGLIKKFSDRYAVKHTLEGNTARCYCLYKT